MGTSVNRFLDNVNEYELQNNTYATPYQKLDIEKLRRTGAGYTNIAGWLFKQNLAYGTKNGNEAIEKFTERYNYHLYRSSIDLGKEKGNFSLFNRKKLECSPFIQHMMKLGLNFTHLRNVTCSSIAPCGTLSLMFRGCVLSYGIEPPFGMYYWKRCRVAGSYEYYFCVPNIVRQIFESSGYPIPMESDTIKDTWDGKYGKPIAEFIDHNKHHLDINFKNSTEIDPIDKLDLMSKVMKNIDSSISTTYMLPENSDWKDVYEFIIQSYKKEVKSIAAFPDRKIYGIVSYVPFRELATKLIEEEIEIHHQNFTDEEQNWLQQNAYLHTHAEKNGVTLNHAPKRPKTITSDVHHVRAKGEDYVVFVGHLNGIPYEVLALQMGKVRKKGEESLEKGDISRSVKKALVTKIKRGYYRAELDNGEVVENILQYCEPETDIITRLSSTALRHGTDIKYLVDQLEKTPGDLNSFAKAIGRSIKKYIPDQTRITGQKCQECGSEELLREGGCKTCQSCGNSVCG